MSSFLLAYAYQAAEYNTAIQQSILLAFLCGGLGGIFSGLIYDFFARSDNKQVRNQWDQTRWYASNFVFWGGGAGVIIFVIYTSNYMPPANTVKLVSIPIALLYPPIQTLITEGLIKVLFHRNDNL